ncbi:MAG: carbohydrate kinase family protein [Desulfarculaceae bacterium]|nr:carbohydrate kinase family protein [Desulfarculaceae bacterium]MCF8071784.1 carbohydrate kinase family protein [Desulfarculaceae bacterium]MCF8101334.1 carbohydrate kinase family protein [Desulfarculaceae bacterium]MCF8117293.1 carbohydrate kinase family protein [Desulfarculaceae bacterium]
MQLYISGSLAYDRIMNFEGRFSDHILPDKIHVLNVCFNVNGLQEKLGGTAGNIAYGLAQLGERPVILACLGQDGERYLRWVESQGIDGSRIRVLEQEFTAGAFITTDKSDNQITGFNPGAMNHPCQCDVGEMSPANSLAIVAPGNLEDMQRLPKEFRAKGVPYIFDPGQSLNIWKGEDLAEAFAGAQVLISNDYELELIRRMTGLELSEILERVEAVITTKGEEGSVLWRGRDRTDIPIAKAEQVLDPTGAGDAYRSGLMKGMSLGLDLAQACLWGAVLASFAVAGYGTQEYSVDQDGFARRLETLGGGPYPA